MLHAQNEKIRQLLLKGNFGLEKESLRIDGKGFLAHSVHPFPEDDHVVRDFCENQTEINTPVAETPHKAVELLDYYYRKMQKQLAFLEEPEYLWPFSNPPYIRNENDIPIANFQGKEVSKTEYREYLAAKYGRYKMTFSGIHFNYSFGEELLRADFELSDEADFTEYKTKLYLLLAEQTVIYGWLMVAVTAASPLMDSSFVEKGRFDEDVFNGMASVRCGELGYWNFFAPVLNYSSVDAYADSIQKYVSEGWLRFPSELYYPVRLKPAGENTLYNLRKQGINHIELRMFDLNPLVSCGVDERDVAFAQLLLVWLASKPYHSFAENIQVQAIQNFKNAAHYDLKTVKILLPNGEVNSVADAALNVISEMEEFYQDFSEEIRELLRFQKEKFVEQENRYSWKIREQYGNGFVKKGLELAKQRQSEAII